MTVYLTIYEQFKNMCKSVEAVKTVSLWFLQLFIYAFLLVHYYLMCMQYTDSAIVLRNHTDDN